MKRSKFLFSFVVAFAILTLAVTTALADVEPPVQETRVPAEETDFSGYTELPENYVPQTGFISVDMAVPLAPVGNYLYTRTPTFYFASQPGATNYQITVWSWETGSTVYTFGDVFTCPSDKDYCYMKPPTKLKVRFFNPGAHDIGRYDWTVRAMVGGVWQSWSLYTEPDFYVLSKGFNNDFSIFPNKYYVSWGSWLWNATKERIDSNGNFASVYSGVYHQEAFVNFDYSVKMKRVGNAINTNSIVFWGTPTPNSGNGFYNGIYFLYNNAGQWGVYKKYNGDWGTPIQSWTSNPVAINEYASNVLRVRAIYPYVDFWINGVYLGWYMDTTFNPLGLIHNAVGFDAYDLTTTTPLRVTSAVLTIINTDLLSVDELEAAHDPSMQLGLDPVVEGADPDAPR